MSRVTSLVVLALILSSPASVRAAEPKKDDTKTAPTAKSGEGASAKKASSGKGAKGQQKSPSAASAEARQVARSTKSVFMYAVEACDRDPKGCDQTLRDDAEKRFVETCGACNTAKRCEAERDAIVAGNARASQDPCAP